MRQALYVLDVYAIVYRSYFAFISRPLRNPEGKNVSAAYGFFRFLFALLDKHGPESFVAAFDSRGPTFRHEMFDDYKATRQKTPQDLIDQVPLVEEILAAIGIPMLRRDGYEADDIIATLASRCRREGRACYIVSGDKDLLQLVGGSVKALRPREGFTLEEYGPEEVMKEWGVGPERILDLLSLTGDASDNVPGVKGIGEKTALKLLGEFDSLDDIYSDLDRVKPDSVKAKLEAGAEMAKLSRQLITLVDDLDLGTESIDGYSIEHMDRSKADPIFLREGMRSLVDAGRGAARGSAPQPGSAPETGKPRAAPERDLFGSAQDSAGQPAEASPGPAQDSEAACAQGSYSAILDEQALGALVDRCIAAGAYGIDTETDSLDALTATPIGVSLSPAAGEGFYIPLESPDAAPLPLKAAVSQLSRLLSSEALAVGHNIKFDLHVFSGMGLPMPKAMFDTMIAAWVVDAESNSFSLESLAERLLGLSGLAFSDVVAKGDTFGSVPLASATRYAGEDADFTLRLYRHFEPELRSLELADVFHKLEMPLIPILARMEREGIAVDAEELRRYGVELESDLSRIQAEIWGLVGHEFNIASTKQLQEVLFVERKLPVQKRTKTGFSTDTSVLEELAPLDPVPQLILRHRSLAKLKSTYVDTLAELAAETGRVHTTFLQTGAATGRLSSRDPNLQNIPIREEEGRRIRRAFKASPGCVLISADYSQIELVVMAHLSGDANLKSAFMDGVDVHKRTAAFIFDIDESQVSPEQRRVAKTINFGVIYGMSAFRLARDLGIPNARAQAFIDAYFGRYSGIAEFMSATIAETERTGFATTMFGRRRRIPAIDSRNRTERQAAQRVAVNTPIQGSAADIVKKAMLKVDGLLASELPEVKMLLQVHDELVFECPERLAHEAGERIRHAMESAAVLSIPLRVGIETSYSWGDMH